MSRRGRRGIGAVAAAAALALPLAGCPRSDPGIAPGTLVVATEGSPGTLDPRFSTDAYGSRIVDAVMRGLVEIGPDGAPRPDLAVSWDYHGPTTLVVRLRPDERFHDGTTVTPAIVAATLDALRDPDLGSPRGGALLPISSITPLSDAVRIELRAPSAPLLVGLSVPIMHPDQVRAERVEVPIGSGPFRFAAAPVGDEVVLLRADGAPPPAIQRVVFRTIPDPTSRTFALETGAAHLAQNNVPASDLERLGGLPILTVQRSPGWNTSYLGFLMSDPLLGDARVRRAIALAVDRAAILRAILFGTARPTDSLLPPQHWAYAGGATAPGFDPAAARALLDAAGHPDPDGDGPRPRFVLEYKTSTNPERIRIAQAIAADLGRVGIEVGVRSLEFGTFFSDVKAGNFQMYSLTWVGIVEPDLLHYALHSASMPPQGANRGRVADPPLDAHLDAGRTATTRAARREAYAAAQARLRAMLPVVPLWTNDTVIVRNRRLQGFAPLPSGSYRPLSAAALAPR